MIAALLQLVLSDAPLPEQVRLPRIVASPAIAAAADYPLVTQRPLFAPDRKPDPRDMVGAAPAQDLTLIGVALAPGKTVVLLKDSSGTVQRLATGGSFEGWSLVSADNERATLERNGQRRVLELTAGTPQAQAAASDTDAASPDADADSNGSP